MNKFMKKIMKKSEGFTLVELIVVIAILAILAGVAVPVYSGYIKKANEAADLQVLSAMNTAFAVACTENGVAPTDVDSVEVDVATADNGNKTVSGIEVTDDTLTEDEEDLIDADFGKYFAGNTTTVLKYYKDIEFEPASGNFKGVEP